MFKKAKQKIHNASVQVALSTAISPIPIVDMVLIVCRSTMLTRDIATIYGYRLGVFTTILLLKQGAVNALFVGKTWIWSNGGVSPNKFKREKKKFY